MARGRHRNSALHRVLIPAALGGAALACAGAAWLVGGLSDGDALVLRALTAAAALAAVAGALLLRRWDLAAGRQVARERAARAGLTWQAEERRADLEEAQEQVSALESKINAKRAELAGLRSEHAALLRRYATAETERARALEGRRQLALEAAAPARALPAQATDHRTSGGAPTSLTYLQAAEALSRLARSAARQREEEEARQPEQREPERREAPSAPSRRLQTPPEPPQPPQPQPRPLPAVQPPPQRNGGFDFFGASARQRQQAADRP